jgi:transposase
VACDVIAPALIPTAAGDRVKTDRRDCRRLARLHRSGDLVAIGIPTESEEAVRDLCRARAAMVGDRTRIRHRLSKFCCADVAHWYCHGPFTEAVARLAAYPPTTPGPDA